MAFYEDLSPYNYTHYCEQELNVGWLEKGQPFPIGDVPEEFLNKLELYTQRNFLIFKTKGMHRCEFCSENHGSSNEIRVISDSGIAYAAPTLILHYIAEHKYLPPQEFVDAVLTGPIPGSEEYDIILKNLPSKWERRKPDLNDEDYEENLKQYMINQISENVDKKIVEDLLGESEDFKKFVEAYNKVMPAIYLSGNKKKTE